MRTYKELFLQVALPYAEELYYGIFRKGPKNIVYMLHPLSVIRILEEASLTDVSVGRIMDGERGYKNRIIALLHDGPEERFADSEVSIDDTLKKIAKKFGRDVREGVDLLTKRNKKDRGLFNVQILSSIDPDAKRFDIAIISCADRCDNLQTLGDLTFDKALRLRDETEAFHMGLAERLCPSIAARMSASIEEFNRQNQKRIQKYRNMLNIETKISDYDLK